MKTKILFLCVAALLAGPALCSSAPPIGFAMECSAGSIPGTWNYTLYNTCNEPITLDSMGLYGSSASSIAGVDPFPSDWYTVTDDPVEPDGIYPDYYQVTWANGGANVPDQGANLSGFIVDTGGGNAPSQFEVCYFADETGLDPQYFDGDVTIHAAVPEPSSLLALAIPGLGIAAFRRRRS